MLTGLFKRKSDDETDQSLLVESDNDVDPAVRSEATRHPVKSTNMAPSASGDKSAEKNRLVEPPQSRIVENARQSYGAN